MIDTTEKRALAALEQLPLRAELQEATRHVMHAALAQGPRWQPTGETKVLDVAQCQTPFGNAADVLAQGPRDDAERALATALAADAWLGPHVGATFDATFAAKCLRLATFTPFDPLPLIDVVLGKSASFAWGAIALWIERADASNETEERLLALVGAASLIESEGGRAVAESLVTKVHDPKLRRVLGTASQSTAVHPDTDPRSVRGELIPAPRGVLATTFLALTGLLAITRGMRAFARVALAYRCPAEVTVTAEGVRIRASVELLGRRMRDREYRVPAAGLVQAVREVRYPRLAFYAGLLALALGSYVGVNLFVDGVRSASIQLLVAGLLAISIGVGLDLLLSSILPSQKGRCRLLFVPKTGKALCVMGVHAQDAERLMAAIRPS